MDDSLKKLSEKFLENRKKDVATMKEALKNANFETLETFGHRLKGNAESFGFEPLGKMGECLEIAAKNADIQQISRQIDEIEKYVFSVQSVRLS